MCPIKLVTRLFHQDEDQLPPELKAQRNLNKSRLPQITRYIVENPKDYVFSSLTASIDGEVQFEPYGSDGISRKIGSLSVAMEARFLINDGQHRRAAIEEALKLKPDIGNETISIVFYVDSGLKRSQQMFADLNRHAIRPTKSLGILYDHRDPLAQLVSELIKGVPVFNGMTEMARSTISNRSRKLFTLSGIYLATQRLLGQAGSIEGMLKRKELAIEFWIEVSKYIPEWKAALERKVTPSELRQDCIHAHSVALQAIAIAGSALLSTESATWKKRLSGMSKVNWDRRNAKLWEGRALVGGRVSKSQGNVILTSNVIKKALGLSLDHSEKKLEDLYEKGR
jgi:DNA sulfur modification protein DndB